MPGWNVSRDGWTGILRYTYGRCFCIFEILPTQNANIQNISKKKCMLTGNFVNKKKWGAPIILLWHSRSAENLPVQSSNSGTTFELQLKCYYIFIFSLHLSRPDSPKQPTITQATEPVDHAEGPVWDYRTQLLYFVDIHSGKIFAYKNGSDGIKSIKLGGEVSIVIPTKTDPSLFIVAQNRSVTAVKWDGEGSDLRAEDIKVLTTVAKDFPTSRFNDGKADKKGNLWMGKKIRCNRNSN